MIEMLSDRDVRAEEAVDTARAADAAAGEEPARLCPDWPERAERVLARLINSPTATVRREGRLHFASPPLVTGPDILLQTSLLSALSAYAQWRGKPVALCAEIRQGLHAFVLPGHGSLRTHLPQQAADQADSWLLCRSLVDLGRMALAGDTTCRAILLGAAGPAMAAARRFDYHWPVAFDPTTLRVLPGKAVAPAVSADVNAVYAFAMLQGHELTGYDIFLDEARAALSAASSDRAGCSVWRGAAAARLWRLTGDRSGLALAAAVIRSLPMRDDIDRAGIFLALDSLQRDAAESLDADSQRLVASFRKRLVLTPWEPAADAQEDWITRSPLAFALATGSGSLVEGAPFRLYSDCLIRRIERAGDHKLALEIDVFEDSIGTLAAVRLPRRRTPALTLTDERGNVIAPADPGPALIRYALPCTRSLSLGWIPAKGPDS